MTVASASGPTFADPSCRQPIVAVPTCAADVKYVAVESLSGCRQDISSLRRVTGPATTIYVSSGGRCIQSSQPNTTATGTSLLATADEVGFDQFVEARITTEEKNGITQRIAVGSDGSREVLGYRSAALDVDCTFQSMADGVTRCVAPTGTAEFLYSDSACSHATGALYTNTSGGCPTRTLMRELDQTTLCARTIFEVLPATSASDVASGYVGPPSGSGASCSTLSTSRSVLPIEDVTGTFVATSRIGSGPGRLVPALVSGNPQDALVPGWHDKERDVDCVFAKASDGKIRCLPTGANGLVFWTDTVCKASTRLAAVTGQRGCVPERRRFARATENACATNATVARRIENTTRVFSLTGEPRTVGPSSVETSPGRCVTVAGVVGAIDATEVNPADYVEATIATE